MGNDEHGPAYPEPIFPETDLSKPSPSYPTLLFGWALAIALLVVFTP